MLTGANGTDSLAQRAALVIRAQKMAPRYTKWIQMVFVSDTTFVRKVIFSVTLDFSQMMRPRATLAGGC
jgi:hypothetical protein